jgi:RNA polymerase II-associated factor 1
MITNLKTSIFGYLSQLHNQKGNKDNLSEINNITKKTYLELKKEDKAKADLYDEKALKFKTFLKSIYNGTLTEGTLDEYYNKNKTENESIYALLNRIFFNKFPFIKAIEQFDSVKSDLFTITESSKKPELNSTSYEDPLEINNKEENDEENNEENEESKEENNESKEENEESKEENNESKEENNESKEENNEENEESKEKNNESKEENNEENEEANEEENNESSVSDVSTESTPSNNKQEGLGTVKVPTPKNIIKLNTKI